MIHLRVFTIFAAMSSCGVIGQVASSSIPSVSDYFPELRGDLTKVAWAHAVNNKALLEKALTDDKIMMLEADIVLGTLIGQNEVVPIMAHPPANTSDLSLQMFLDAVVNAQADKRKGVKLDFKSTDSFKVSWDVIEPLSTKIDFPFFLNADILPGPVDSTVDPVNPKEFLSTSSRKCPGCTLSIGWTTRYAPGIVGNYTTEQLDGMRSLVENNKIIQPVTLCLRAGIAAQSEGIENLVKSIDEYQVSNATSVTVWMSTDSDPVDIGKLKRLILTLQTSRVYLDVPDFVRDQLDLDGHLITPVDEPVTFH